MSVTTPKRVKYCNPFVADHPSLDSDVRRVLRLLPPLAGKAIVIGRSTGLGDRNGASHAISFVRRRRILFACVRAEFPRIFVHEVFHFVWLRLGNAARNSFGQMLAAEIESGARGELGWSAEWRKRKLTVADVSDQTRFWREYCCESFCDTGAWIFCGIAQHDEFTLADRCRKVRRDWFGQTLGGDHLPI
jgi:hypothetical protein